jgi:hypothetical protein
MESGRLAQREHKYKKKNKGEAEIKDSIRHELIPPYIVAI